MTRHVRSPHPLASRTVVLVAALAVAACGGAPAPGASSPGASSPTGPTATAAAPTSTATPSSPLPTASASPSSTSTPTSPTSPSSTPGTSVSKADVAAASAAALRLFRRTPVDLADPSAGWLWSSRPWRESPMSPDLLARLVSLQRQGWFDDRHCGEDYVSGTQTEWPQAPTVAAAYARPDGTVTVVVRPHPVTRPRDLTVTMARIDGRWLATDLARGTGPHASIFAPSPSC